MRYLLGILITLSVFACSESSIDNCYDGISGFNYTELNQEIVRDFEVVCRVWGLVKYHHPVFADSNYDIDQELFTLLKDTHRKGKEFRNSILQKWIRHFGDFEQTRESIELLETREDTRIIADFEWIKDTAELGDSLSLLLENVRYAGLVKNIYRDNVADRRLYLPDFSLEKPYDEIQHPDYGFRLLALFRLWNQVEYFFPYKYITDQPWDDVLTEFIYRMAEPEDGSYKKEVCRLIARLDDTHAWVNNEFIFGSNTTGLTTFYSNDDRFYVISGPGILFHHQHAQSVHLLPGDEIIEINGCTVEETAKNIAEFTACSNKGYLKKSMSKYALSTHEASIKMKYLREGILKEITVPAGSNPIRNQQKVKKYERVDEKTLYVNAPRIREMDIDTLIGELDISSNLVLDFRSYPRKSEMYKFLTECIYNIDSDYVLFMEPLYGRPGFYEPFIDYLAFNVNRSAFKGRIMVLVDQNTMSAMEYQTMIISTMPNVGIVGSQTAGADGGIIKTILPGGIETQFSGIGVYYPDGTPTQRVGIKIDYPVEPTLEGMIEGRDEILEYALELLKREQ